MFFAFSLINKVKKAFFSMFSLLFCDFLSTSGRIKAHDHRTAFSFKPPRIRKRITPKSKPARASMA